LSRNYEKQRADSLKNPMQVSHKVKQIASKHDKDAQVYLFGSAAEGKTTGLSDIDIMIISKDRSMEYKIKVEVYKEVDAPVEIHYITEEEYERWYKRFVGKMIHIT